MVILGTNTKEDASSCYRFYENLLLSDYQLAKQCVMAGAVYIALIADIAKTMYAITETAPSDDSFFRISSFQTIHIPFLTQASHTTAVITTNRQPIEEYDEIEFSTQSKEQVTRNRLFHTQLLTDAPRALFSLEQLIEACKKKWALHSVITRMIPYGVFFGASFQKIATLQYGPQDAIALIEATPTDTKALPSHYTYDACTIYTAFQVFTYRLAIKMQETEGQLYLPAGMASIDLRTSGTLAFPYVHFNETYEEADIYLLDAAGNAIIHMQHCRILAVSIPVFQQQLAHSLQNTLDTATPDYAIIQQAYHTVEQLRVATDLEERRAAAAALIFLWASKAIPFEG